MKSKLTYFQDNHKNGSILAFVLIMMGVVMILALGMMQSTTVNQQSAMVTDDSAVSFQAADSGVELIYLQAMKNLVEKIDDVKTVSGSCDGGTVSGAVAGGGSYLIDFYDEDGNAIADCNGAMRDVRSARVRGIFGKSIRVLTVQVPVPQDVTDGLIASIGFDEGSGDTADDGIANSNNNTALLNGGASWSSSAVIGSHALSLDGGNDYAGIADDQDFDFASGDDWAFSIWVRPDNVSSEDAVFTKTFDDLSARYGLFRDEGDWKFVMNSNSVTDSSAQANKWSHLIVQKDGATVKLFVNAVSKGTMTAQNTAGADDEFLIAKAASSPGIDNFDGLIDAFKVYNRFLTDDEILILCRQGQSSASITCGP